MGTDSIRHAWRRHATADGSQFSLAISLASAEWNSNRKTLLPPKRATCTEIRNSLEANRLDEVALGPNPGPTGLSFGQRPNRCSQTAEQSSPLHVAKTRRSEHPRGIGFAESTRRVVAARHLSGSPWARGCRRARGSIPSGPRRKLPCSLPRADPSRGLSPEGLAWRVAK